MNIYLTLPLLLNFNWVCFSYSLQSSNLTPSHLWEIAGEIEGWGSDFVLDLGIFMSISCIFYTLIDFCLLKNLLEFPCLKLNIFPQNLLFLTFWSLTTKGKRLQCIERTFSRGFNIELVVILTLNSVVFLRNA